MAAPPAPPPPPPLHSSSSILSSGWRTSTDSHRQTRATVSPSPKPTNPRLDAQTLQHAAAGLRKTEYNQSLRSHIESLSNGRVDRPDQRLPGQYWPNGTLNDPMEANQAGESIHAPRNDSGDTVPLGDLYRYTNSLKSKIADRPYNNSSSSSSSSYYYSTQQQRSNQESDKNSSYLIDPKAYIREFATHTPAQTVFEPFEKHQKQAFDKYHYDSRQQQASKPMDTYKYSKELRDQGLTKTQRIANQFQQSNIRSISPPQSLNRVCKKKDQLGGDQIDTLIRDMQWKMKTGTGAAGENNCCKCGESISTDRPGCTALEQMFHIDCFTCKECNKPLAGGSFYNVDGKPLCENDYMNTLDRCSSCGEPIMEKLLRASGGSYHPGCFVCTQCRKCLDGIPFTIDANNKVHCVACFHEKFAPRCAACSKPIIPEEGEKESVRVVAMDKSFHVNCYRCEDCNMQLSSKVDGQGCYPLDQHLYCKNCNGKRLVALAKAS